MMRFGKWKPEVATVTRTAAPANPLSDSAGSQPVSGRQPVCSLVERPSSFNMGPLPQRPRPNTTVCWAAPVAWRQTVVHLAKSESPDSQSPPTIIPGFRPCIIRFRPGTVKSELAPGTLFVPAIRSQEVRRPRHQGRSCFGNLRRFPSTVHEPVVLFSHNIRWVHGRIGDWHADCS